MNEFYYEDFVHDISEWLKKYEKEYIEYSVDSLSPLASVNVNKLAVVLSKFWYSR